MRDAVSAWLGVGAVFGLGFVLFVATGHDDAYITYWVAHTLASAGELVNYNGARVEQSSSLLHVLLLAGLARLTGASIVAVGYWLGVAAGGLAMLRAPALARALGAPAHPLLAVAVGTTPVFLYWWFGGLETTLAAWLQLEIALLGAALIAGARAPLSPLALLTTAAFVLVRPENAFLLGTALVAWIAVALAKQSKGTATPALPALATWLGSVTAAFTLVTAFRLAYFGAAFPQPVLAKVGGGWIAHLVSGLGYLAKLVTRPFALPLTLLVAASPVLLWRELRTERAPSAMLFVLLLIGANLGFVAFVGGDSMIGGRFFAPVAPLAVVVGFAALATLRPAALRSRAAWAVLLSLQLAGVLGLAIGGTGRPLWVWLGDEAPAPELRDSHWSERANLVHLRDLHFAAELAQPIASLLARQAKVRIASVQAGMVMYYTALRFGDRIEFFDLKGLSTRDFAFLRSEAGLDTNSWGLALDLERYFAEAARRPGDAFRPDLIFDIRRNREAAERNGYVTVLELDEEGAALAGPVRLYQWAALRADRVR